MLRAKTRYLVLLLITVFLPLWQSFSRSADGAELTNRSVQISTAVPSASDTQTFGFTYATGGTVGSLVFQYCSNSPLLTVTCQVPAGLDVSGATIISQTGVNDYGVDNVHTASNKLVLTRVTLGVIPPIPSTYTLGNITNPSTPGQTVFVRITDYATSDASGPYTDNGSVAFAINSPFSVGAYVPPFLRFCVGITVASDCSTIAGDTIELGNLTTAHAAAGESQFSTGTNADDGYVIFALGTTITSGNNAIPALTTPTASFPGTAQFGINLRANSDPPIGQDPSGAGTGAPTANYDNPNLFMFNSGDSIATSPVPSDYNRMSVSYLVNISGKEPVGIYSTTLTYVASVDF